MGLLGRELVENVLASFVRALVVEVLKFVDYLAHDCLVAAVLHSIIIINVLYSGDRFALI